MIKKLSNKEPSLDEVIAFIYDFLEGYNPKVITGQTLIENDLGIAGDDSLDLLEAAECFFDIDFSYPNSFRDNFGLAENEYLFNSEGFNGIKILVVALLQKLGLSNLFIFRRLCDQSNEPIILDLTIEDLHKVICKIKQCM